MNTVGEKEKHTQENVIKFFRNTLGYIDLGNWQERKGNSNIERTYLSDWLRDRNVDDSIISKVIEKLEKAASMGGNRKLYDANMEVYEMLRYGVNIQPNHSERPINISVIDWGNPLNNNFSIAEEVTLEGEHTKRPDLVLYVNGIAIGVFELKRSTVSISEGIRQNITNQKEEYIGWFFTTVQIVMAGNRTEGLRYSVIDTREKYWLRWKEKDVVLSTDEDPLYQELHQFCNKERLLEILHDFIVFDSGRKKICRHNQFFGVKAAQEYVKKREGGIIWHTQGSGKSLTMVWLAKWILEDNSKARVLIITDRTELDEQIEQVFHGVDEDIRRTKTGADLISLLGDSTQRLGCSLVHKFGSHGEIKDADVDKYIEDIKRDLPQDFKAKGEFFVYVDECHRTQSGILHQSMKELLPEAMFIGFTGTPLLSKDKKRSIETFGTYIHTYKYDQAVNDGVVLDLLYEARDIDQELTSQDKIDQWFESKTSGLTDMAKSELKKRWGTMQKVLSSKNRLEKIVEDIVFDMETRDRLKSGNGNAMLVSDSIYNSCRLFDLFQDTELQGKCAIISSYDPSSDDITKEDTGEGTTENLLKNNSYRKMLAKHFNEPENTAARKVRQFEQDIKKRFIEQPNQMKLLIVVDKLLTGFDAPPATYLYIDKKMQDHNLFQAICRVNRLHTEDKEYGYIIDYKELFPPLKEAMTSYTSDAFENYDHEDVDGLLKDRLKVGKKQLDVAREAIKALCEPVEEPKDTADYLLYFCAEESGNTDQLKANEEKRIEFYKLTSDYLRAYTNLANDMQEAEYTKLEESEIKKEVKHYEEVRKEIKLNSGDYVNLKMYEPAMRHLLDTYIQAGESEKLLGFDDITLIQMIVQKGEDAINSLPENIRSNESTTAETIENNMRRYIVDRQEINPTYYNNMSEILDELIELRKQGKIDYKQYLSRIVDLSKKVNNPGIDIEYPSIIITSPQKALFDNLGAVAEEDRSELVIALDEKIRRTKKADWRENNFKEREVRNAIAQVLLEEYKDYTVDVDSIFELVKNQDDY